MKGVHEHQPAPPTNPRYSRFADTDYPISALDLTENAFDADSLSRIRDFADGLCAAGAAHQSGYTAVADHSPPRHRHLGV